MTERQLEQQRILDGLHARGLSGRAVDDQWVCDSCHEMPSVTASEPQKCPACGVDMLQVLVVGDPIVL